MKQSRTVDVSITDLSKKGNGLASLDRPQGPPLKVEVPFTMPGDEIRATLLQKRAGTCKARLDEILVPSPSRITPRCIHFGSCGGCRFQHFSYADQLSLKETQITRLFEKWIDAETEVHPILGCPDPWQYRNKMEYSFSSDASGKKFLGLILDSSRGHVFNLTECHLTRPWFVKALECVRAWWRESDLDAYHLTKDRGSLRTLTIREGMQSGDRLVMLTVSGNPDFALQKHHLEGFVAFLRAEIELIDPRCQLSIFLRIQQIAKGQPTEMYEMLLYGPDHIRETMHIQTSPHGDIIPFTFHISASAFFQPNTFQAEQLYSRALQGSCIPLNGIVYDLYCGTGTLGISVSKKVKQVIGIEISPESALDARTNASLNGCNNVEVFTGAVRDVLKGNPSFPKADLVMVDPPRSGLDRETIDLLLQLNSPKILYISCNPETQAMNVEELVQHGYKLSFLQPIDQFPQTYHVENIVVLTRL